MIPLKLQTYKKKLQSAGYAENTIEQYVKSMDALKRQNIGEDSPSADIYKVIGECDGSKSTKRMYLKAIAQYEKLVIGREETMLKGSDRIKAFKEWQEDNGKGVEPKKSVMAYRRTITDCKNDAMRTALRLQLESGLRVGEITALKPEDITMRDGHIWLYVAPQKTQYDRHVKVYDDPRLYEDLQNFLERGDAWPNKKVLYNYLLEHGGNTHDLRRHNLRRRYLDERKNGSNKKAAVKAVMKQAGHTDPKNTKRYLGEVYRKDRKKTKKRTT